MDMKIRDCRKRCDSGTLGNTRPSNIGRFNICCFLNMTILRHGLKAGHLLAMHFVCIFHALLTVETP